MRSDNTVFSDHALFEMHRRNIDKEFVIQIINDPDSIKEVRSGRIVAHKTLIASEGTKPLLYRVFIDIDVDPNVIVTVYKTSKIQKYEAFQ